MVCLVDLVLVFGSVVLALCILVVVDLVGFC